MYYVYIIKSTKNNKLYTGFSKNLATRIKEHNTGRVTSTKLYRPWKLVYYEAYSEEILARKTEIFYKTGQGRRQIKKKLDL
ncbi:GIY-YIG nuclease family protein [Candidatus Falkowbacteria bacterium]|nr:GIY-YIG nuclease family protein [Candidatus Falkowbacteria bacterium]